MDTFNFIHVTDTHFGLDTYGTEDPITGLNTRAQDGLQAFDQLIDHAIKKDIKLVIHSGDVFNTKSISQSIVNAVYARIKRLIDAGIDVMILQGNHDASQVLERKNGLDLANTLGIEKLYVTRGGDFFDLGYIQICSVSYWHDTEKIAEEIQSFADRIDWKRPAVLVVHLQVEYANFPGCFKDNLHFTPLSLLTSHPWNYVAMGHIHKPQKLHSHPPVYYGGSLVRCSFAEEDDPKGFMQITINHGETMLIEQHPVKCLKMLTLRGTMSDIKAQLDKATNPEVFKQCLVRCIVDISEEPLDEKYLKAKMSMAFKLIITKETKKTAHVRIDSNQLTSMQTALESYFKDDPDCKELLSLVNDLRQYQEGLKLER